MKTNCLENQTQLRISTKTKNRGRENSLKTKTTLWNKEATTLRFTTISIKSLFKCKSPHWRGKTLKENSTFQHFEPSCTFAFPSTVVLAIQKPTIKSKTVPHDNLNAHSSTFTITKKLCNAHGNKKTCHSNSHLFHLKNRWIFHFHFSTNQKPRKYRRKAKSITELFAQRKPLTSEHWC